MGPFGSNIKTECYTVFGVPVLNGSNLTGFELNETSFNYVSREKADSLSRSIAHRGDIVITHRGTLGQIVLIPENSKYPEYVISQSQFRITCDRTMVIPEYLVFYFHTRQGQHDLLSNSSQVGVPALARPTTTFQTLEIPLPSIDEQTVIVRIISHLNQKIAVNNQLNGCLAA
jgi:type I restriction enzyme S subunit